MDRVERVRVCGEMPEEPRHAVNVFLKGGPDGEREVHGQRWHTSFTAGGLEATFVHFQRWKGHYGKLRPGDKAMPKLHGRKIFKMSPHGFAPLDVVYDDVWGGNVSAPLLLQVDGAAHIVAEARQEGHANVRFRQSGRRSRQMRHRIQRLRADTSSLCPRPRQEEFLPPQADLDPARAALIIYKIQLVSL